VFEREEAMRTVVYLEDRYNDEHIVFTKTMKPNHIVYLATATGLHAGYYEDFADYILTDYPKVNIEVKYIEKLNMVDLKVWMGDLAYLDGLHLASTNGLLAHVASRAAESLGIPCYYTDLEKDQILCLEGSGIQIVKENIEGIDITEIIDIAGGDIIRKTSMFNEDPLIRRATDFIAENQTRWKRLKRLLGLKEVFLHDELDRAVVEAVLRRLDKSDYLLFKWMKTYLKDIGYLKTKRSKDDNLVLRFKSPEHKQFLFISGSWLESLTYKTLQLVEGITDIESGVSFAWDFDDETIKNEIDVLATYKSRLYCFSCKDSASYDVNALNELSVYAQRLGGQNVTKVLVVTDLPRKEGVLERAREMDVEVLIYEGNPVAFRRQLERLFSKNMKGI